MCDVTHAVSVLLCEGGARRLLPAEECFALLLAALCHDAEHPGTTNSFLARSQDPLVRAFVQGAAAKEFLIQTCSLRLPSQIAQYGSKSTLEQHHAAVATALLQTPKARGVLGGLAPQQTERVLALLSYLIGATDIEHHGVHMAAFAAYWGEDAPTYSEEGRVRDNAAARDALLALLLKAADVSNAAKPWPLAARWAGLLKAEHLLLGTLLKIVCLFASSPSLICTRRSPSSHAAEREVDAGLTVTPFLKLPIPQLCKVRRFGRNALVAVQCAACAPSLLTLLAVKGFIEGIAAPMLQHLGRVVPFAADVSLPLAHANAAEWGRLGTLLDGGAAVAFDATTPPERPHIGITALACAAEHTARREADAAGRAAPAGAPPVVHTSVSVPPL